MRVGIGCSHRLAQDENQNYAAHIQRLSVDSEALSPPPQRAAMPREVVRTSRHGKELSIPLEISGTKWEGTCPA